MTSKVGSTGILLLVFCATFLLINTLHFQFFPVHVVLYDAFLDVVIAAVAMVGLYLWRLRDKLALTEHEVWLSLLVGFMMCAFYAISVPTIIDRSLSIYILEKLDQRGGGILQDSMVRMFIEEYIPEHHLMDLRMTEGLNSGTMAIKDGCVYLTPRGRRVVAFTRFYRTRLLPKKRQIMGQMTDAMTDPFRNSVKDVPYKCKPPE